MGDADGDAPPRDRPGLLFLTYAVPAFFAWSGCWLGTRRSGRAPPLEWPSALGLRTCRTPAFLVTSGHYLGTFGHLS